MKAKAKHKILTINKGVNITKKSVSIVIVMLNFISIEPILTLSIYPNKLLYYIE